MIQTKIETYCEILSFFIIKLIADDHTLQMQAFIVKNILECVIDDSLKQKDDEYLTNSYLSPLSPITVGFILFHELLRCWLRGSTGHLSFVIFPVPHVICQISISFLPCASFPPNLLLNVNSLCFHMIKGIKNSNLCTRQSMQHLFPCCFVCRTYLKL